MGKTRSTYRAYTDSELKTRSEVPAQESISLGGSNVECSNITVTKLKNTIGSSSTKISELISAASNNQWSGFSPYSRVVSNPGASGSLINSLPTSAYKLGDSAAYNHEAITPGWVDKSEVEIDQWIVSGNSATISSQIKIGEVNWKDDLPSNGIVGVAFVVYDTSTSSVIGYVIYDIDTFKDYADFDLVTDTITADKTCELKAFLVNDLENLNSGTIVLPVPNVSTASFNIKIKQATSLVVESGWNQTYEFLNKTTGYVTVNGAYRNQSFTELTVYATLYNWLNESVGQVVLFSGAYTASDVLNMSGQVTTNVPIDDYGYRCEVSFEASI